MDNIGENKKTNSFVSWILFITCLLAFLISLLSFAFLLVCKLISVDLGSANQRIFDTGIISTSLFLLLGFIYALYKINSNTESSLWKDACKRLIKNKLAIFGLINIVVVALLVTDVPILLNWIWGITPEYIPSGVQNGELVKSFPPSANHLMGTDDSGRDLFARVLQGGRISLMVGIISTIVSLIVGVSYGSIAGYLGGKVDEIMMRIVDVIYSIPYILIVIVLLFAFGGKNIAVLIQLIPLLIIGFVALILWGLFVYGIYKLFLPRVLKLNQFAIQLIYKVGAFALFLAGIYFGYQVLIYTSIGKPISSLGTYLSEGFVKLGIGEGISQIFLLFFAIGFISWLTMARVVRGQILSLKNQEFILAAKATGVSTPKIIFKHLVPNILGPVIVYATLTVPSVMLSEAFLSFLGIGVQAPYASWGSLVNEGIKNISIFPWQLIFPGVMMALTLFSLNFLGDGLRDAIDPQTRKF